MAKGFVYFVSWENDLSMVKIGFSGTLKKRLQSLCTANSHRLMVRKVLLAEAGKQTEAMLHEKFNALREAGEWFRLKPPLMDFLEEEGDEWTRKAEARVVGARIGMAHIVSKKELPYAPKHLENGIRTCRHYVLWLLNECMQNSVRVSTKALADHPANDGRFALKTIYNEVRMLEQREMVSLHRHNGLLLTLFGLKELERWNAKIKMNH